MAGLSTRVGAHSELLAATALIACGLEVNEPYCDEVYDLSARDPQSGVWITYQVKTARIRQDRDGYIVVYATKGNGTPYTPEEVDYLIGIVGDRAYLIENRGLKEYWVSPGQINEKWKLLPRSMK